MFKQLTTFAYKRTAQQAIGFYIAYFLLLILISGATGVLMALVTGDVNQDLSIRIGILISTISCTILAILVAYKKHILQQFNTIMFIILSAIGAMFGGALVGLVFVAHLTTKACELDEQPIAQN